MTFCLSASEAGLVFHALRYRQSQTLVKTFRTHREANQRALINRGQLLNKVPEKPLRIIGWRTRKARGTYLRYHPYAIMVIFFFIGAF